MMTERKTSRLLLVIGVTIIYEKGLVNKKKLKVNTKNQMQLSHTRRHRNYKSLAKKVTLDFFSV